MIQLTRRVAIIDDGIYRCEETEKFVSLFLEFDDEKRTFNEQSTLVEQFSHGTCCAMIIHKYCQDIDVVSLKILSQRELYGSTDGLVQALKWCNDNNISIINLSLGTTNIRDFQPIQMIVDKLVDNNIIVVAAVCNDFQFTMPSLLDNVIGVVSINPPKYIEEELAFLGVDFQANSIHDIVVQGKMYVTPNCNSFATPYVVANLLEGFIDLKERISYINDIKCVSKKNNNRIKDGKLYIDFANFETNFTVKKKEYVLLGIQGKKISDIKIVNSLINANVPVAILENSSLNRRNNLKRISQLSGCDVFVCQIQNDIQNLDYRLVYKKDCVIIYKKRLFFWVKNVRMQENQIIEALLEEIYGRV